MANEPSLPESVIQEVLDRVLSAGIDGAGPLDSAKSVASAALAEHGDRAAAIDAVIADHTKLAATEGFLTGLGGFVTMVVALPLNLVAYYVLAARLVASIAEIRGLDTAADETRTAILLVLSDDDAPSILKKAGVSGAVGRVTFGALRNLPPATLAAVNKGVAFRLLVQTGEKTFARLGRLVPGVGGLIGGGIDAWMMRRLGGRASDELLLPS